MAFDPSLGKNNKRPAELQWNLLTVDGARKIKNAVKALSRVEALKHLGGISENAEILAKELEWALQRKSL
ncbi:MAG: hypothetical protein ACTSUE_25355 [Promethearchaeota archaeon]